MDLPGIKWNFLKHRIEKKVQQVDPFCPWKHLVVYLALSGGWCWSISNKSVNFQVPTPPRQQPQIDLSGETKGDLCQHKHDKRQTSPQAYMYITSG